MVEKRSASDAWESHAQWYKQRHGRDGDVHHQQIIIPAILRQMRLAAHMRVIDCCCGQGVVSRALAAQGVQVTGIDGSQTLIKEAQSFAGDLEQYAVGDAHHLEEVLQGQDNFDGAVIVLALQDLDPIDAVLKSLHQHLKTGAELIIVLTHPCFRIPQHSDWFFDRKQQQQKRQLDTYMSAESIDIRVGSGAQQTHSTHYHRPLQYYLRALGSAGFAVVNCEELCSHKRGSSGNRSAAEDRAQREFPMFLLLKATALA